jgi:hypothetical protein
MKRLLITTMAVICLAACSNMSPLSPTQPSAVAPASLAVREGASAAKAAQLTVSTSVLTFGGLEPAPQTFVATTKGAGEIFSAATPGCLVTPGTAPAVNDPGNGHSVTFTVSVPSGLGGGCTVTVTDKKGNTATVEVRREFSASDLI